MLETVSRPLLRGGLEHARRNIVIAPDVDHGLLWCEERLLAEVAPTQAPMLKLDAAEIAFGIVKDRSMAEQLLRYFEAVSLSAGTVLIEQGAPSDEMYLVESGRAAVRMQAPGNAGIRLATVGPGGIVGEVAFYLGQPRTASIIAEAPMEVRRLSRANLLRLHAEMPSLALRFHEGIAAMLAARVSATNRLVGFLAD
jgi:SulP family sulfate permease